jgi:eukaryotic-like serine/threonine-protein kinase
MATDSFSRWPDLDTIFETALALEAEERETFLDRRCGGDPDLRAEVDALLAAVDASSQFLEDRGSLLQRLKEAREEASGLDLAEGAQVGPYRLLGEIGRGGMGVVYLAERADGQFEQRVALKLLGGWAQALGEEQRFQRERQILARLQHPNIARLLDGGITRDGRPYFVMDHVDGVAIDRYCDLERLGVRARLEIFLSVCSAVELAHRHLVVHRDIKPGNVLVTAEGTPKLLDFGIAKLLQAEDAGAPADVTRSGLHPMTPEYASPEMVRGGAITTASDVYQLGVLLYQLLAGSPPHELRGRTPGEIERTVGTVDPERPSVVVARPHGAQDGDKEMGGTPPHRFVHARQTADTPGIPTAVPAAVFPDHRPEAIARARGTTPDGLRRQLRGDLDTIVLKALRKESERRYGSVEEMARDIRRHLEGRPVLARPDTFAYRTGKFVHRHWFGVGTTVTAMALMAGFAVAMARQAERTAQERNRAEQVTEFLAGLFRSSDPGVSLGDTLTVRHVLDRGAVRIRAELADQPEVRARLLEVMGDVYSSLGLYGEARPILEEALTIQRARLGPDDPRLASSLSALGHLLLGQRDMTGAEALFREQLRIARAQWGNGHMETAGSMNDLALVLQGQGRVEEAEPLYRSAISIYRGTPGPLPPNLPVTLTNLGWILMGRGEYAGADSLFREALDIRRHLHPEGHPRIANSLSALASVLSLQERHADAEPLAREALVIRQALFGDAHPSIADALLALAGSLAGQGRLAEAEPVYRASLDMFAGILGKDVPDVARVLSEMSGVLSGLGRNDEGEQAARKALAIYEGRYGKENVSSANARANLASVLQAKGDHAAAICLYREALELLRGVWPQGHPRLARIMAEMGRTEMQRGNPAGAEAYLREALDLRQRLLPEAGRHTARLRLLLGECLLVVEREEEAEALLLEAHATLTMLRGPDDPDAARARSALLRLYESSDRLEDARSLRGGREGTGPGPRPPGSPPQQRPEGTRLPAVTS